VEIPVPIPSVLNCECAGSALPFIPLGRQIAQLLEKPQPVPNPSAHQPGGSLPTPHHDRMSVCAGVYVSGWVSVRESRTPSVARPADATA